MLRNTLIYVNLTRCLTSHVLRVRLHISQSTPSQWSSTPVAPAITILWCRPRLLTDVFPRAICSRRRATRYAVRHVSMCTRCYIHTHTHTESHTHASVMVMSLTCPVWASPCRQHGQSRENINFPDDEVADDFGSSPGKYDAQLYTVRSTIVFVFFLFYCTKCDVII